MANTSGDRAAAFPAIERKHGHPIQHWFDLLAELGDAKYAEQVALLREGHGFSQAHANAVVMHVRGSTTSRRFDSPEAYFASVGADKAATAKAIFAAITKSVAGLELVIAWNQPILKAATGYVFGLSVATNHLTLNPFSGAVMDAFAPRLAAYPCAKKTFRVPVGWKPDAKLLADLARARLAELE